VRIWLFRLASAALLLAALYHFAPITWIDQ